MRKLAAYSAAALLAVSAIAGGVSYAQDSTATPTSPATATSSTVVQRAWLGVKVSDDGTGVTITRVSADSPAETAQLEVGDVITAVNGTSVDTADELRAIIDAAADGDVVTLTIERDSAEMSVDVTLSARAGNGRMGMFSDPLQIASASLGVTLEAVDEGYQVVAVDADSSFALEAGDVITAVNGEAVASLDWRTLMNPAADSAITLTVQRSDEEVTVTGDLTQFGGQRGGLPGDRQQGNGQNNPPGDRQPGNNGQPGNGSTL